MKTIYIHVVRESMWCGNYVYKYVVREGGHVVWYRVQDTLHQGPYFGFDNELKVMVVSGWQLHGTVVVSG